MMKLKYLIIFFVIQFVTIPILNEVTFQVGIAADSFIPDELLVTTNAIYSLAISNNFSIDPSVFIRTNFTGAQIEMNVLGVYKKMIWAGMGYRIGDSFTASVGVDIKEKFRIGYAFDHTKSQLQYFSNGSHEIILAFLLK